MTDWADRSEQERNLKEKTVREFRKFVAIFLYLWVVFALLSIHETIILAQNHLNYAAHTLAVINAFVFAKVLLIGDHLHLGTRFKNKPLIYPVLHKCFAFSVLLISAHLAERLVVGMFRGNTAREVFSKIAGGTWTSVLSMGALSFVMLMPFFAFRELGRAIGEKKLRALFLGDKSKNDAAVLSSSTQSKSTNHFDPK